MAKIKGYNLKGGQFIGGWYIRRKSKDKWGNTYKGATTYRNANSGLVASSTGKILGVETNHQHRYSSDPRRARLSQLQTKQKKKIMMILRSKGRVR